MSGVGGLGTGQRGEGVPPAGPARPSDEAGVAGGGGADSGGPGGVGSRGPGGVGSRGRRGDLWEEHAGWWQAHFTQGVDPEYEEQILPLVAAWLPDRGRVLDVGTGEGQVARLAAGPGRGVVGIDPARAQVSEAVRRGGPPGWLAYAQAEAARLPARDGSFNAVVACLVFEHITDAPRAIAEVARVLRPGGRFLFLLNHPLLQTPGSGWIDDRILGEQYWRVGPYLVEDETVEEVEKGVFIPFVHRPLSAYVNAMAASGLVLVRMEEPAPPAGFLARAFEYGQAATIPRLLMMVAERVR